MAQHACWQQLLIICCMVFSPCIVGQVHSFRHTPFVVWGGVACTVQQWNQLVQPTVAAA